MRNEETRTLEGTLFVLEEKRTYSLTTWADGPNADRYAEALQTRTQEATVQNTITIEMAPGGGFVARLQPTN